MFSFFYQPNFWYVNLITRLTPEGHKILLCGQGPMWAGIYVAKFSKVGHIRTMVFKNHRY